MTASTSTLKVSTVIGQSPHLMPLRDGTIKPEGVEFEHVTLTPITVGFRRMCRNLEFDVCEMAVVTYYVARQYGLPMTALPIFTLARFEHGGYLYNTRLAATPKDFEGKKFGFRAYTVTPGVWARAFLEQEHGLDLDKVTWVMADEEHVAQYHADKPANVEYQVGANLGQMLADGELAGAHGVQRVESPDVQPLVADPQQAGIEAYKRTGAFPLIHLMVIKDSVLKEHPWLAGSVYEAFKAAREHYLKQSGSSVKEPYDDPMPMGLEANRHSLRVLMDYAVRQKVLKRPLDIDELFPGNFN